LPHNSSDRPDYQGYVLAEPIKELMTAKAYEVTIDAGGTFTLLDVTGKGVVKHIFATLDGASVAGSAGALWEVYINEEETPRISLYTDWFLGDDSQAATGVGSKGKVCHVWDSVAYLFKGYREIDIPFKSACKIVVKNRDTTNATTLYACVEYLMG